MRKWAPRTAREVFALRRRCVPAISSVSCELCDKLCELSARFACDSEADLLKRRVLLVAP